jgi:hypothetical protein
MEAVFSEKKIVTNFVKVRQLIQKMNGGSDHTDNILTSST